MKKIYSKLNTAIIYTRVSSQDQLKGYSLETQEKLCNEYALRNGLEVVKVFREEGESAKTTDRTELKEMIKFISLHKGKIGHLIIYKIDRLTRDGSDYFKLKTLFSAYGVELLSASEALSDDPAGKFMGGMLAIMAEFDNNNRKERTVGGMKEALATGNWTFKAPIGYKNSKHDRKKSGHSVISVDPESAPIVRYVFEEYAKNIYTYRELSKRANRMSNGKFQISPQYLKKILNNPFYYGQIESAEWEISVAGNHEPLISKELYDKVQIIQTGGAVKNFPRNRDHADFPLRGVLCACGGSISGYWTTGKMGKRYAYYRCGKKDCEFSKHINKIIFETEFTSYLEQLTPGLDNLEILEVAIKEVFKQEAGLVTTNHKKIESEIANLKLRKENMLELKLKDNSLISDDDFKSQNIKLDNQIQNLQLSLIDFQSSEFNVTNAIDFSFNLIKNLPKVWQALDVVDFKALRSILFPENLAYHYPEFKTPTLSFIYSINLSLSNEKETLVALRGIEPRFAG